MIVSRSGRGHHWCGISKETKSSSAQPSGVVASQSMAADKVVPSAVDATARAVLSRTVGRLLDQQAPESGV